MDEKQPVVTLYIEPKPANNKGYLRRCYEALHSHQHCSCWVLTCGFPPLYVETVEEYLTEISAMVSEICEDDVLFFRTDDSSFRGHSNISHFPEPEAQEEMIITTPQPHAIDDLYALASRMATKTEDHLNKKVERLLSLREWFFYSERYKANQLKSLLDKLQTCQIDGDRVGRIATLKKIRDLTRLESENQTTIVDDFGVTNIRY